MEVHKSVYLYLFTMAGTKKGHQTLLVKKVSNISHGSVVTHLRCGGIFTDDFPRTYLRLSTTSRRSYAYVPAQSSTEERRWLMLASGPFSIESRSSAWTPNDTTRTSFE